MLVVVLINRKKILFINACVGQSLDLIVLGIIFWYTNFISSTRDNVKLKISVLQIAGISFPEIKKFDRLLQSLTEEKVL